MSLNARPDLSAVPGNTDVVRHAGHVTGEDRVKLLGQRPATVWLSGLSGAGKSTLAYTLERRLIAMGRPCCVLDGDNVRHGLCRDLGFLAGDRAENIRRVAEVARLMNDAGLIVIAAFISPYRNDRAMARQVIGVERFIETHVSTPLSVCESRDPKGLYKLARAGKLAEFTGVSAPYEAPECPALALDTQRLDIDECVELIFSALAPFVESAG